MRALYQAAMLAWVKEAKPKPLLLWGARQVGKTTLMRGFADLVSKQALKTHVYLNFETDKKLPSLFAESIAPEKLVRNISLYFEIPLDPLTTLFIFDEIQECEDALNSLKYFAEAKEKYHVMAAGSLLGVKHSKKGFPVGKVSFLDVHPLTFAEFLEMTHHPQLAAYIDAMPQEPAPTAIHEKLMEKVQEYMWTGGMPEVVATLAQFPNDYKKLRDIQHQIVRAYQLDFAKHAPTSQVAKISEIFAQVPLQIAKENKKFQVAAIGKNARMREYSEAMQWLVDAGIIHRVTNISRVDVPLAAHADQSVFKLYLLDVGLLGAMLDVPAKMILDGKELFANYRGALAENFVLQQLVAQHHQEIYYWTSQGSAEVEFVVQSDGEVFPLEVKSGVNVRSKSLDVYGDRYPSARLSRCSALNYKQNGRILNYPLYGLGQFPNSRKMSGN